MADNFPSHSISAEQAVIRIALSSAEQMGVLTELTSRSFYHFSTLVSGLLAYYEEVHSIPTEESFKVWIETHQAYANIYTQYLLITEDTTADIVNLPAYTATVRSARLQRELLAVAEGIVSDTGHVAPEEVLNVLLQKVVEVQGLTTTVGQRSRSFVWETTQQRWERYESIRKNPNLLRGIPLGIRSIDTETGGLHSIGNDSDVVCIFGKSGNYKSRLMLNFAFNQATCDVPVCYITREMSVERISILIDARESLLTDAQGGCDRITYKDIEDSLLGKSGSKRYKNLLLTMYKKRKYPLWLVDAPALITTADITYELELFKVQQGHYPKVLYLDYANLVNPTQAWTNSSERLDFLFLELNTIAKSYKMPIVTAVRESRGGSLQKERDDVGMEHIGLSQQLAYHCHLILHVDQSKEDREIGVLQVRCKKNRYGGLFGTTLHVSPEYTYIGDEDLESANLDFPS